MFSMIGISVLCEATSVCQLLHFLWEKPHLVKKHEQSLFPYCSTAVKMANLLLLVLLSKFEMTFVNITGLWGRKCALTT